MFYEPILIYINISIGRTRRFKLYRSYKTVLVSRRIIILLCEKMIIIKTITVVITK